MRQKSKYAFLIFLFTLIAWSAYHDFFLMTESRIFKNEPFWITSDAKKEIFEHKLFIEILKGQLPESVLKELPVIWWHPNEKFKASDPALIFSESRLAFRELVPFLPFLTGSAKDYGAINKLDWKSVTEYDRNPTSVVTRLHEKGGIKAGYAGFELIYNPESHNTENPPLLWRLSKHPVFEKLQPEAGDEALVPIELWYHMTYNYTAIHFGFHDGDWESFLFLFHVKKNNAELIFKPWMVSVSAHGHTEWHCFDSLSKIEGRTELFSAVGTHATFTKEGIHPRLYPDRTARGEMWKTWLNTRYLPNEEYYGFSGSWGRTSYVDFQNAPIPPGPDFKYLPRELESKEAVAAFQKAADGCNLN